MKKHELYQRLAELPIIKSIEVVSVRLGPDLIMKVVRGDVPVMELTGNDA